MKKGRVAVDSGVPGSFRVSPEGEGSPQMQHLIVGNGKGQIRGRLIQKVGFLFQSFHLLGTAGKAEDPFFVHFQDVEVPTLLMGPDVFGSSNREGRTEYR